MGVRAIVENATDPAIGIDAKHRIVGCNRAALELLGHPPRADLAGRPLRDVLEARDILGGRTTAGEEPAFWELLSRAEPVENIEFHVRKTSGELARVTVSVVVGPGRSDPDLVLLLRPVLRRRKADAFIEQVLAAPPSPGGEENGRRAGGRPGARIELTPRQLEVLLLLSQGLDADEIARSLEVSENTVRSHIQNIFTRMGVHNQVQAVARAIRDGLI